ncbi:MAG: DUF7948 domain-containing protein [Bryobacteraceae bacterium]
MRIRTLALGASLLAWAAQAQTPAGLGGALPAGAEALAQVPAWFEPDSSGNRYISRSEGYHLLLETSGARVVLTNAEQPASLRILPAGAKPARKLEALDPLAGRTNYLTGQDRSQWRRGVPHYGKVKYAAVYDGIDLEFRSSGRKMEYDFLVAPGADPSQIALRFEGAESLRLEQDGTLVIDLGGKEIRQPPPDAFQEWTENGAVRRARVESGYRLGGDGLVRFVLGSYDRSKTLVIDPVLIFAGYFGGDREDIPTGVAMDEDGYVWLTGTTRSAVVIPPDTIPYSSTPKGSQDVFVAKLRLEPAGPPTVMHYTYLGGSFDDRGGLIEVIDPVRVCITGTTFSSDFPVSKNAAQSTHGGLADGFVAVLDLTFGGADTLVYSTFLGGTQHDTLSALYVAPDRTIYVAGYGASVDIKSIPETALQPSNRGEWEATVYHLDPWAGEGESLLFSSYYGGASTDVATGVSADEQGNIYLTGYTMSEDFPIEGNLYQGELKSSCNLFIVKIDPSREGLDRLVYGTYFGGSGVDIATSMRRDAAGGLWITGYTSSPDLPVTPGAYQGAFGGGATDAFVLRFNPNVPPSEAVTYLSYLGGIGADVLYDVLPLGGGLVALAGYTLSADWPVLNAPPAGHQIKLASDAVVTVLDTSLPGAASLSFSTYFGGKSNDVASRLAPGLRRTVLVAGYTGSPDLPVTDGSVKTAPGGGTAGFLLQLKVEPLEGQASPPDSGPGGEDTRGSVLPRRSGPSIEPQPRRQTR